MNIVLIYLLFILTYFPFIYDVRYFSRSSPFSAIFIYNFPSITDQTKTRLFTSADRHQPKEIRGKSKTVTRNRHLSRSITFGEFMKFSCSVARNTKPVFFYGTTEQGKWSYLMSSPDKRGDRGHRWRPDTRLCGQNLPQRTGRLHVMTANKACETPSSSSNLYENPHLRRRMKRTGEHMKALWSCTATGSLQLRRVPTNFETVGSKGDNLFPHTWFRYFHILGSKWGKSAFLCR